MEALIKRIYSTIAMSLIGAHGTNEPRLSPWSS